MCTSLDWCYDPEREPGIDPKSETAEQFKEVARLHAEEVRAAKEDAQK